MRKLRVLEPLALPNSWEMRGDVPASRADCVNGPRPCPHVECRHHLWLDAEQDQSGDWRRGRQGYSSVVARTMESCALDVAEVGASAEEVALMLGIDDTRVRQIEAAALEKIKKVDRKLGTALGEEAATRK